jgi:hypothetical protein
MRVSFAFSVGYLALLAVVGNYLGFYTILNDFWGTLFLAEHLSLADPRSLHNGFFPIGYPAVVRVLLNQDILVWAYLMSAAASAATLGIVTRAVEQWTNASAIPVLAATLLALHPLFFLYGITTGPDAPTLLLSTTGVVLLLWSCASERDRSFVLAGLLLGAAGLFRQHGFPFAIASLLGVALAFPSRGRGLALAGVGVLGMLGVQVAANLAAGVSALESAQAFNIYKLFNSIDWFHLDRLQYPSNPIEVIRLAPDRFLEAWWSVLRPTLWLGVPQVIAAVLSKGDSRRVAVALGVTTYLYLPIQAVGGSPRGPLLVLPCSALAVALALEAIWHRLPSSVSAVRTAAAAGLVAFCAWSWVPENLANVRSARATADLWRHIEGLLEADGVQGPSQVFTDSFDFYFTKVRSSRIYDYRPRNTGGWAQIDLYGYERIHPPLDTTSFGAFIDSCRARGVSHLVLLSTAGLVVPELGAIQAGGQLPPDLRHVADVPGVRIVALADGRHRQ